MPWLTFPHTQALQSGQCWGCFQPGQAREASQLCRGCSEQSVPPGAGSPRFAYRCVGNPGGPWRQGGWRRWHGQRGEAGQPAAPKISRLLGARWPDKGHQPGCPHRPCSGVRDVPRPAAPSCPVCLPLLPFLMLFLLSPSLSACSPAFPLPAGVLEELG